MIVDAIIEEDGTLTAKVPKSLSGKKVKVIVKEVKNKNLSNCVMVRMMVYRRSRL